MLRGKKLLIGCALGAFLAAGLYAGFGRGEADPHYRTQAVERGEVVQSVLATGTLNPVTLVQVGSQVSGTISALYADFNSVVHKDQVVAQIDPSLFQANVAKAQADDESAQAAVAKAQATLKDNELNLKRLQAVRQQDLVAQSDVDDAQMKADTAKADLADARAKVLQAKAALDLAKTNLLYSTIRSPVDGIVVARNVDVGQTVAASFQAPVLFTIAADLAQMQVDTFVDEADIGKIALGQEASFTVDAYPGLNFAGRVAQVRNAPQQVQNVVTYDVVLTVDNKDLKLKPGMTANVTIETERRKNVLKIPNAALRFTAHGEGQGQERQAGASPAAAGPGHEQRVWVVGPQGRPVPVPVSVGISDGAFSEVLAGRLQAGQQVIVEQVEEGGAKAPSRMLRPF